MIRAILGIHKKKHVNMKEIRYKLKMMSINQMAIYHTLLEAHNVMRNTSSEHIKKKWDSDLEKKYSLRSTAKNCLKVPEKPSPKCVGFSYYGAKLINMIPSYIKETSNSGIFKNLVKEWIWINIPSY